MQEPQFVKRYLQAFVLGYVDDVQMLLLPFALLAPVLPRSRCIELQALCTTVWGA